MRLVSFLIMLIFDIWYALLYVSAALSGKLDFIAYYRVGGEILRHQNIYDIARHAPFIHPAYEGVLFTPLSLLSYKAAYLVFAVVNLGLIFWIFSIIKAPWELIIFPPLVVAVVYGQDSLIFFSLLVAAYRACTRHEFFQAGLFLGAGVFRFQNLLPIIFLLLVWREWKVLKGFSISAGLATVVSCMVVSPVVYVKALLSIAHEQPIERMANLRGLLSSAPVWLLATACILVFAFTAWSGRSAPSETRLIMAITAAALVSFHFFPHDLVLLLLPIAALASRRIEIVACLVCLLILFNWAIPLVAFLTLFLLFCVSLPRLRAVRSEIWQA